MNRRLRILLFAPHFAEYACRLAIGLSQQADILLFLDRRNAAQECEASLLREVEARSRLVQFGSVGRAERAVTLTRLIGHLAAFRPDIVHIQEQPDKLTLWVARVAARFCRLVLTVHDPTPHSGSDEVFVREMTRVREALRGLANGFHVHGAFCERELRARGGRPRPILATPHGVLLVPHPQEVTQAEPGRILMFGRMEAYKGVDTLLDAAEILSQRKRDFRLVLAGRGPELRRLETRIAAASYIELVEGFLAPAAVRREIARASMVVAPYRDATQSGVLSAAFGGHRPVVASMAGGLVDAVVDGGNGLLVPVADAAALANALDAILRDDTLRARLTQGAEASAGNAFAWDRIAQEMVRFHHAEMLRAG